MDIVYRISKLGSPTLRQAGHIGFLSSHTSYMTYLTLSKFSDFFLSPTFLVRSGTKGSRLGIFLMQFHQVVRIEYPQSHVDPGIL